MQAGGCSAVPPTGGRIPRPAAAQVVWATTAPTHFGIRKRQRTLQFFSAHTGFRHLIGQNLSPPVRCELPSPKPAKAEL